jgi:hypothetical protein
MHSAMLKQNRPRSQASSSASVNTTHGHDIQWHRTRRESSACNTIKVNADTLALLLKRTPQGLGNNLPSPPTADSLQTVKPSSSNWFGNTFKVR